MSNPFALLKSHHFTTFLTDRQLPKSSIKLRFMLMNAFNCRFHLWIADAFTRFTVQAAIICVCGYRTERHLKLEELAAATKISKSALGSYENDELKEISHKNLVELAKFYGVSTDYLLCLTENRNHPGMELTELHLSDGMVELLKSGRINNRLLCEIATHEDFVTLMTDTEIYVDGVATSHFNDFNSLLEVLRGQVLSQYQPVEEDTALKALEAMQIQEEDYFCQVTHRTWDAILHAIREAHKDDTDSAPDGSNALKLIKDAKKALAVPVFQFEIKGISTDNVLVVRHLKGWLDNAPDVCDCAVTFAVIVQLHNPLLCV